MVLLVVNSEKDPVRENRDVINAKTAALKTLDEFRANATLKTEAEVVKLLDSQYSPVKTMAMRFFIEHENLFSAAALRRFSNAVSDPKNRFEVQMAVTYRSLH